MVKVSAEVRWFWQEIPPGLESWFRDVSGEIAAGGGEWRTDEYLRDRGQEELGLKRRGKEAEGVEVKGLVAAAFAFLEVARGRPSARAAARRLARQAVVARGSSSSGAAGSSVHWLRRARAVS